MNVGTFTQHEALEPLPPLVREQRRLEAQILPLVPLVDREKAVRAEIDRLLVAAGIPKNSPVTCNGYDVTHNERKGQTSLNADKIVDALVARDMAREIAVQIVAAGEETGEPAKWATVKPSKGAKVRKP